MTSKSSEINIDICILGAGLVGTLMALRFEQSGIKTVVVEKTSLSHQSVIDDHRSFAVSYGSKTILESSGLWQILHDKASPIWKIRVFEEDAAGSLTFSTEEQHFSHPMGYMIPSYILKNVLRDHLLNGKDMILKQSTTVNNIHKEKFFNTLELSDQSIIKAKLIIGAEGRSSPSRDLFSITTATHDYNQTALVFNVTHEKPHHDTAFEIFTTNGPLAFLPLDQNNSAIVWSSKKDLSSLDDDVLCQSLENIFPSLGKFSIHGPKGFYPLKKIMAQKITDHRFVLIGDAAHVLHPVAGQGVNLGWRDSDVLFKIIMEHHQLGLDVGSSTLLENYTKKRWSDQKSLAYVTDGLIRLFDIESKHIKMLRSYGLGLVDRISPLKKFFMKKAMGGL